MKIYYNIKWVKHICMILGMIFTNSSKITDQERYHFKAHLEQYATMASLGAALAVLSMFICFAFDVYGLWMLWFFTLPLLLYYIWYGVEYLIKCPKYGKNTKSNIQFEKEALALQDEYLKPCYQRKYAESFSFLKY